MLRQAQEASAFVTNAATCGNCTDFLETLKVHHPEDKEPSYLSVFHVVFLATIILTSTVGNGLVSLVLVRKRNLSPSSRLVLSLCCSNLMLSCSVLPFPFVASVLKRWTFGLCWCWASAFLLQLVSSASNMTLAAIAIDRYFAIVKPMTYSMTITSAKSLLILLVIWLLALVTSLPPFFGWLSKFSYQPRYSMCLVAWEDSITYTSIIFVLNILLPLLVMAVSYGCIFQIARSKYKKINIGTISAVIRIDAHQPLSQTQIENIRQLPRRYVRKPSWLSIVLQSPVKGFAVICCILGVFCLCWTPYVVSLILAFCGISLTDWQRRIALDIALLSVPSYSVIYGLLNRSIRKDLFVWMRSKNPRKTQGRSSATVGLLDYTPPFSHWQFSSQAMSTPLQKTKDMATPDKHHRKTSDDSGHYSLPTEDADTISSSASQLSGVAESAESSSSQESVDSKCSSCDQQGNMLPLASLSLGHP